MRLKSKELACALQNVMLTWVLGDETDLGPMRSAMFGLTSRGSIGAGVEGSPIEVFDGGG